jgi:hypothetical protein
MKTGLKKAEPKPEKQAKYQKAGWINPSGFSFVFQ